MDGDGSSGRCPRRVLFVDLAPSVGGSVISLYHLVSGLDRDRYRPSVVLRASNTYAQRFSDLGIDVDLVGSAVFPASSSELEPWSGVRHGRLTHWLKRVPLGERLVHVVGFWLRNYPAVRRDAAEIARIIQRQSPDLVHINDILCVSRAAVLAARRERVPALCHVRALAGRNHYDRWLSRSVRGFISISHAVAEHERALGGRVEPMWVVHNGTDLAALPIPADVSGVRAEFGFGPDSMVVGCVGRLVAWKGQRVFLEALRELAPRYPRLCALVVGGASGSKAYLAELQQMAREFGLLDRIVFTGHREDVPELLAGMDIAVHASVSPEPFGRVIIESMAVGTATVATDAGAVSEIIDGGRTGLLVPPGDAVAMATAIARLLENAGERRRLGAAGRAEVLERFGVEPYIRGVERVYESVMP